MIRLLLYYEAATILLAGIDWYRRRKRMGQVKNIDHGISTRLAIAAYIAVTLLFLRYPSTNVWLVLLSIASSGILYVGVRLLLYDPVLAIFNRQNPFKNSLTSDSKTEQWENKKGIGFWPQRALGILGIGGSLLINHVWLC